MQMINHEWVGLMLDIGSYHTTDPNIDIAADSQYAITWQIREELFINDDQADTDFNKIIEIVQACGHRGYLPIETPGEGDPYLKVRILLDKVRTAMSI